MWLLFFVFDIPSGWQLVINIVESMYWGHAPVSRFCDSEAEGEVLGVARDVTINKWAKSDLMGDA